MSQQKGQHLLQQIYKYNTEQVSHKNNNNKNGINTMKGDFISFIDCQGTMTYEVES